MENRKYDIYERIFKFVVSVIKLIKVLPKTEENKVIFLQIIRSDTSMGANSEEADGSSTSKDFIHCFTIVRKEAKETSFWLKLLSELNPEFKLQFEVLIKECHEIVLIVSKIISNSRKK
ncbi:MAG TPA: four helix bundle protein [Alphaproteobacteria bacterium]|jgi:four helix bundle protein|nr:four helix bundle protein [Alphaproteobacteria bacterium]